MLARFSSCYRRFLLPSFAGFSGTIAMLSKIEKNLLFGTMRNRQVLSETTTSAGFTARELTPRQRRDAHNRAGPWRKAA